MLLKKIRSTLLQPLSLLFLLIGLSVAISCRTPVAPTAQRGGTLSYRVSSPPQTFNYLKAADESTLIVAFYLLGGRLIEFDHQEQRYVPGLAESWKPLDDGRTLEVILRPDLKFSDGHPITAEDVQFTFQAIYDDRTPSPIFRNAMIINGQPIEVSSSEPRRLRLVFPESIAIPENYLSNLAVLPRHILERDLKEGSLRNAYGLTANPQQIVTSGAFTAKAVVPGERITLRRNPYYWKKDGAGASLPYLDEMVIEIVSDANNALVRLQQGTLGIYDRIRPADYAALRAQRGSVQVFDSGPGLNTDYFWFNLNTGEREGKPIVNPVKHTWFSDVRFRRAVSSAIDRENIASTTLQGLATPLYGFVSPGNRAWVAKDLPRTAYDLEKARALMREAGFTLRDAQDGPELSDAKGNRVELTMIVPAESQPRMQMAAVVQQDLAKLGIKIQIAPIEFGELLRRISQSYDYDAALLGAITSEPDPSSYVNLLRSSSSSQHWHPKQARPETAWEARIDELLGAQARESNVDRRRAIFHEIQTILSDQLPVIPLVARHLASAANRNINNYKPSVLLPYSLWNSEELSIR